MDPIVPGDSILLILNHNGRALLAECLPSVVQAAREAPGPGVCRVAVVDNESTDDSLAYLAEAWPEILVIPSPNDGLASFNAVLRDRPEDVALLLNNDVKLEPGSIGPLVAAVRDRPDVLFAAPACWTFDRAHYEGMRTRVATRFGLVQGLCRFEGFEAHVERPDLTASSGPILAVDRAKFLTLGGYDPIYHPGRIEDLDLGFRAWMAGLVGYYVPESVALHQGFGSFGPAFGRRGCDHLAARNTLLFAWKNLAGRRLANHLAWLAVRVAVAALTGRADFLRAVRDALRRLGVARAARRRLGVGQGGWVARQEAFFRRFAFDGVTSRDRPLIPNQVEDSAPGNIIPIAGRGTILPQAG